jgi:N-acetylmuramoyl-L-alanine amidase
MYSLWNITFGPQVAPTVLEHSVKALNKKVDRLDEIVLAYTVYGKLTRCGNLMPFAQAVHETGWFSSWRWTKNFNPAGIGATNDGAEGNRWKNPAEGILAQYAHLLAYSVHPAEYTHQQGLIAQLSPRYSVLKSRGMLGSAPRWVDLNGKWAFPGTTYAQRIEKIAETILNLSENPKLLDMELL